MTTAAFAFSFLALILLGEARDDALVTFAPALRGDGRSADQVELKNGTKLGGRVVYEDETKVVLRDGSRFREFERQEVKLVVSRAANAREALGRWLDLKPADPHALLDIVRFCERMDLDDDARVFARAALVADPRDTEAHETLGHQRRSAGWVERDGARWVAFEELGDVRSDWKTAWELASTHYHLRTNLDMATAVTTLLDLECFYQAFFSRFGRELTLYEVVEPMGAHVHRLRDTFPIVMAGRGAYYDEALNTLLVDASNGLDRGLLIHEATHQLLSCTAERARGSSSDIPAWLDEGLAEYMRACTTGLPGRARFVEGLVASQHFARHAQASEPYSLARVLSLDSAEFQASSKSDLKYAQAYTLVQFCLHGQGEKYRRRFFDFVRGAYRAKGSPTHFKTAIDADGDAFEKAWTAYVREMQRER